MPLECLGYTKLSKEKFKYFFGYCLAEIECPKDIKYPLLQWRTKDGRVIYLTGKFKGIYFSEELKEVMKYGYTVNPIKGQMFSKADLFSDYVYHFYDIKKYSDGPVRFLAKMLLNQLYGFFGRSRQVIETKIITDLELVDIIQNKLVQTIVKIGYNKNLVLIQCNTKLSLLQDFNEFMDPYFKFDNIYKHVKSNVAIASAVTSYGRIEMIKYKTLHHTIPGFELYYSDTDSIFCNMPLPSHMIGNELGLVKDELNGYIICEAYFLGIKKYGYFYINSDNKSVNKSTFAGILSLRSPIPRSYPRRVSSPSGSVRQVSRSKRTIPRIIS